MEEARAVIARLNRIEAMERAQAPVWLLLNELELLMLETTRWLEREKPPAPAARAALECCLLALERDHGSSGHPRRRGDASVSGEEHSLVCPYVE